MAGAKLRQEIGDDVVIRSRGQLEGDALLGQDLLQLRRRRSDLWARIMIEPGQNVGGASDDRDTVGHQGLCHFQGDRQIGSPVVDPGQKVAMQIDHLRSA